MSAQGSNNQLKFDQIWRWMAILVWIAAALAILAHFHDRLYSTSIDVGLHGTLVSRLMESSDLPAVDENLAEMATYPRIAHSVAAWVGSEVDSALDGMQYVAYFSVILLWSSIGYGFLRLPSRRRYIAFTALVIALLANRAWFGLEIFGSELIATYFFAHFVAQALAFFLLVISIQLEWRRPESFNHLLLLGLGGALLTSVHLLPAVETIGTLGVLVVLSAFADSGSKRTRHFLAGTGIALFSLGLVVVNPDFMAMYRLSANNGLLIPKFVHSVRAMAILAICVALLSFGLIVLWWRKQKVAASYDGLLLKYFGAFGMTISGLCAIQILLLAGLSKGSEYACFKYASGLQSMFVLNAVLLIAQLGKNRISTSGSGPSVFAPSLLAILACACVFPNDGYVPTGKIIAATKEATLFAKSSGPPPAGTHDYAIGIAEIGGIGNFLVSRVALHTPSLGPAYDILLDKVPRDPTRINRILSSSHSDPWDIADCRRGTTGSLVVLEGSCVYATFTSLKCADTIEFSSGGALDQASRGFSKAELNGRWSEGASATLTCETDGKVPRAAFLQVTGMVTETHRQRMIISVNSGEQKTIEFNAHSPSQRVEIDLPNDNSPKLEFRFSFPDAISPNDLGINSDARTLGVFVYSIRFAKD